LKIVDFEHGFEPKLLLVGIIHYYRPCTRLGSKNISEEKKETITTLLCFAKKVFPQQELDQRFMELLHVENTTLLLVNVRDVNNHLLQVRCRECLFFQQRRQPVRCSDRKVNPESELVMNGFMDFSTYLVFFRCATCSASFMCFANSLAIFGSLRLFGCLGSSDFRDLTISAARIPDAVTTMVCGAPTGFLGVGSSAVHCFFRNADILPVTRGPVQLVLSRTVLAIDG
jgi:hypothetical protein